MHRHLPVVILRLLLTGMFSSPDAAFEYRGPTVFKSAFGGEEVVVILERDLEVYPPVRYQYKLLATKKTSTTQKEMQEASDAAFEYRGQTVFKSTFGGEEVVVILERDLEVYPPVRYQYKLLATKKTSTMQKEMGAAADQGFVLVGLTVSKTKFGGTEVVTIMRRRVAQ